MKTKHLAIILSCLLPLSAAAESELGSHCLALWANGGVAEYIGSTPGASKNLGGGGGLGLGYEWRGRSLLVQTGIGGRYVSSGFRFNDNVYRIYNQYDSEGDLMLEYQYLERQRRDSYSQLAVQIPILVGVHSGGFYFLAGPKVGVNVLNQATVKGVYSAQGVYEKLIDPLANMDNHMFFTNRELKTDSRLGMQFNIAASLEIGGEFVLRDANEGSTYMRVGAFADFNILDDRSSSDKSMFVHPLGFNSVNMFDGVVSQTDYLHSVVASSPVRQLLAGVKLTFLFSSGVKYGCVICQGGYPSARDRRRGSRLMVH